jgi:Na+-translocating ferredoxin:NAD+ oxidoreductase RnfC subunit
MNMYDTLSSLISNSSLDSKDLKRKIMATLQLTNDFMTVKALTDKILNSNFEGIKEDDLNNLIKALTPFRVSNEAAVDEHKEIEQTKDDIIEENQEENVDSENNEKLEAYKVVLEQNKQLLDEIYELQQQNKKASEQMQSLMDKMNNLERENKEYRKLFNITDTHKLVEVSDEDVNKLYMLYKTEQKTEHKFAFIIDNKLVKSYYNLTPDDLEVK